MCSSDLKVALEMTFESHRSQCGAVGVSQGRAVTVRRRLSESDTVTDSTRMTRHDHMMIISGGFNHWLP